MKHLLLLRHAEAVAAGGGLADADRPLTEAGRAHARNLGTFIRSWAIPVQRVVCSSALRARQTAEAVIEAAGLTAPLIVDEALYNASGEQLLAYLQGMPDDIGRVMVVGHVPGVAELVSLLVTEHIDLALVYRPCTLIEIETEEEHWADLYYGVGLLRLMLPPALAPA